MAIEKTIVLNVDASKGVGGVKDLNNELGNTSKAVNQTKTDMSGISGVADNVTGGAVSKFSGLTGVIGNVSKGFTTLKGAIMASGIGLLVVIIASVISAFKGSEEGQNKFAKLMGVIGSVVGNVMDVISDLGEIIIGVLSGDSEAIKSATAFGKKIFDVVGLPIKNIISVVTTAANVIKGLWNDGIDGALTALENGVEDVKGNFKDAANAINDGANALKNFGEEALREAKIAQQIADQRAKADKTDRELIVQRAEADRKVAELREQALDREKYNTKQRIGFLNEASRVEQEVTNKEIQSAILRRDAIVEENKLSKSNKDALKAEEEAKAAVINLETKRLNLQKALTGQISALKQQEKAENQAAFNERKKALEDEQKLKEDAIKKGVEDEKKRIDAIENLRKSYAQKLQDLEDTTELQKIQRQEQRALAELDNLKATEEQKAELIKYYADAKNKAADNDLLKQQENKVKELELNKEFENLNFEEQRVVLAEREALLLEDKTLSEEQRAVIEKIYSDARQKLKDDEIEKENQLFNAKVEFAQQGLKLVQEIAGKGSKIGKAAAIAQTVLSGIEAVQNAYTTAQKSPITALFPGYPYVQAGLAGVFSAIQLAKIKSAPESGGGGGGGGSSVPSGGGGISQPSFNVVGTSGVNQIADTLNQEQQPIQAFVVGSNVTTQQALDRNIVDTATIG
jgi:hypothetical protein